MKLRLIEKQNEIGNVKTFVFEPESQLRWTAGQYMIYTLDHENKDLRGKMRFFTISNPPYTKHPSITTRIENKPSSFKKNLDSLKIGHIIEAKGPDGDFIIEDKSKKHVLIAGGIGITPFHSILKQLNYEKSNLDVLLLYSNKDKNIVFKDELDTFDLPNLKIEYLIGKGIDKNTIEGIDDFKNKFFYVSGPDPMVKAVESLLDSLGVPKKNQYYDYFSGYESI